MSAPDQGNAPRPAWPMSFFFPFASPSRQAATGGRPGRVVAVCSVKGGVGKTTTAVNLAAGLSLGARQRVLLVDADPQGHATGCLSGLVAEPSGSLATALPQRGADLLEAVASTRSEGLDLVAAGPDLQAAETALASRIGRETVLRGLLEVPRTHYDYVIVDCPPSLSLLAVAALAAADAVLVPSEPTPLAICGFGALLGSLADVRDRLNPGLRFLGVVLTRFDARNTRQNAEALETLQATVGDHLFATRIGVSTELARARLHGQPTVLHAPRSRAARQYLDLAGEVRARLEAMG
jgi:chromosome partitioning protein